MIVKHQHTNTDDVLTIKFYNESIHSSFQTNEAKLDLLSVNLIYYALVMHLDAPIKTDTTNVRVTFSSVKTSLQCCGTYRYK